MADVVSDICPDIARALNACADPVFVVDERSVIVQWNPAAEESSGVARADAIGKHCYDLIAGTNGDGRQVCRTRCDKWAIARRGQRVTHFDLRVHVLHDAWVDVSILPIADQSGRPIALAHIVRNAERNKRLERFVRELASGAREVLAPRAPNGAAQPETRMSLTAREQEVLGLLARGASTAAMADRLGVSRHTVHNHVATLLSKLGVHSRAEAVAHAFEHHLVET